VADRNAKLMTYEDALGQATDLLRGTGRRFLDWMGDAQRIVFLAVTGLLVAIVVLLDLFGGKDAATLAGHLIDLAKFVLPTVLASAAAVRYSQSRLLCCVMQQTSRTQTDSTG
jgi:hypothetical protein